MFARLTTRDVMLLYKLYNTILGKASAVRKLLYFKHLRRLAPPRGVKARINGRAKLSHPG